MARRKVTLVQLPAGRIPRSAGNVPPAKRAVGMYGGKRSFVSGRKLKEVELVMTTNGKRPLEKQVLRRRREEIEVLDEKPWKIKTLAAETRLRTAQRRATQQGAEFERRRQQARIERVGREAEAALAAFRWRQKQYKQGKEQVA